MAEQLRTSLAEQQALAAACSNESKKLKDHINMQSGNLQIFETRLQFFPSFFMISISNYMVSVNLIFFPRFMLQIVRTVSKYIFLLYYSINLLSTVIVMTIVIILLLFL